MTSLIKRSLLATAGALALAGCGLAGSTAHVVADLHQEQTPAAVEAAFLRQFDDLRAGNSERAFATYTKLCQREIGEVNFAVQFGLERMALDKITGSKTSKLEFRDVSVQFTPQRASVTAVLYFDGTRFTNAEPTPAVMVYEDGRWRSDSCRHAT
ncbi:MAG: hypothetical protein ABI658_16670 [Acidimicrobiales bacterium]